MIKNKKGFTLIELVVVIVILGILAAIGIPNFLSTINKAKESVAIANVRQLEHALMTQLHLASADQQAEIFEELYYSGTDQYYVLDADNEAQLFFGMPVPENPLVDPTYNKECYIRVMSTDGNEVALWENVDTTGVDASADWQVTSTYTSIGLNWYNDETEEVMFSYLLWVNYAYGFIIEVDGMDIDRGIVTVKKIHAHANGTTGDIVESAP